MKNEKKTNYDIVIKLIGEIDPVGETNEDDKRFENLEEMISLVDRLIVDLLHVASKQHRGEYSLKRSKDAAEKFLVYQKILKKETNDKG